MSATDENKENVETDKSETKPQDKTPRRTKTSKRDKNDPSRFQGGGTNFKAKLIGIEPVPEARGDKMCQEAMVKLKAAVKTSGEHKQKMVINVSLEGLKLLDEKTGSILHHHAVHKISFISRDMTDNRAFGYVYGGGDGRHDFFGIKTEKAAEGLVLSLRDLFQVVFEMKKREMEEAKRRKESTEKPPQEAASINRSASNEQTADNVANEKKVTLLRQVEQYRSRRDSNTTNTSDTSAVHNGPTTQPTSGEKADTGPGQGDQGGAAVGNLLDLESELAFIQQGINQMDALPAQPETPASAGWGDDPWGQNAAFMNTPTSPPNSAGNTQVAARPDVQVSAFPVNFNDAFQQQADPFVAQGMGGFPPPAAAPTPPPRQNSSPVNPFSSSGGSDMFRPSPQQSPGPGMFRPSPQQSPQPSVWPTGQAHAQQAFPPSQAFPPQQDFPPPQQTQQAAFPAQGSFDNPAVPAFPPSQPQQDLFGGATSSPFAGGLAQATSTPNQAATTFGQQPQQQQPFGKVASDPFKNDPFFSSSTPPPATTTSVQDKYAVFSEDFSRGSGSVFGDSPAFGGSGSVFDNASATNGASASSSTLNNAFGSKSPTMSGHSASPVPTPPQRNASSDNLFQDLDMLGSGKKEQADKSEFFKQPPKPSMNQLSSATPPPTMEGQPAFMSQPAVTSTAAVDPFGSRSVNVSEKFNQPFANQSLEDKPHDPFDTSNIVTSPKMGPFDTSQLKPKPAESPPVQRSHKPNDLAFSTPAKNGAFEDSFTMPSPDAPPPPLPRESISEDAPAPTPPPRPTFARAATIDMSSGTLPFEPSAYRSLKFNRQATVDMGDIAPPPAIPPRPADANPPALPPRPSTSASNTSSPVGTRRSSCTTPPLPPRLPLSVAEAFTDRHPSPQTTGSSASSSHEPSPHHPPTSGSTVSRARPRPRPRTPGSGTAGTTGSLTLSKLPEQPSAVEHMQDAFVRDTQIRQSDNTQLTARRLANKTLVRNQSEPMFSSSLPDGFRDSFRGSPADFSTQISHSSGGSDAFPVSFPQPDAISARSQTPSEHSMDTDRVSESLTFDSARSHTDSPAFHSRSDPFPQDFDPFGDEQPKDPFSESPEEEVFTTKAITVDPDPFAEDPFASDPFAGDSFEGRPKSGSSLGNHSNADTSSQYSDCRSTHESHSHSNSDSQAEAHTVTLPKEALSHWESFSEKQTPTEGDKTVVDKFAAATASSETKDGTLSTNGLTNPGEIRRDPFGSLDPLTSVDIKAKLQIKENLQIKEELQWAFSNKNQPPEETRDWSASGATNQNNQSDSTTAASVQSNQTVTAGPSDHVTSAAATQSELALGPETQSECWASDGAFSSSSQQPFAALNGGGGIAQPMVPPTTAFGHMTPPMQQQTAPAMPPRPQSVGNPFAPNNQIYQAMVNSRISAWQKFT